MSSKQTTQSTNQYNQPSMNAFNTMTPQAQGVLSGYMNDPFNKSGGNPFYNLSLQSGLKANAQMNQGMLSNLTRNMSASGFGGGNMPGFMQSQLATAGRNASAMNSNTFLNNALNAQQLQLGATNQALGYKPLQTGGTQTQTTSGLGTWLPTVAGTALGAVGGGLASKAAGGSFFGGMFGQGGGDGGNTVTPNWGTPMSSGYGGFNPAGQSSLSFMQMPSASPGMAYNPLAYSGANPFLMGGH